MVIEKGKVYGYSYDELKAMGKRPEDFEADIKVDNIELELSYEEINAMFPNQFAIVKVKEFKDKDQLLFDYGCVYYYQCEGSKIFDKVEELNKSNNTDLFIVHRQFDVRVDGDVLWL